MRRFVPFAVLSSVLMAGVPATGADAAAAEPGSRQVAAPGACAEPRRFEGAACTDCGAAAGASASQFSVAGPARMRFSPADVAAGPDATGVAPPTLPGFSGRGPCDTPGSCTGAVRPAPTPETPRGNGPGGGLTVVERPPRPGGPPGSR